MFADFSPSFSFCCHLVCTHSSSPSPPKRRLLSVSEPDSLVTPGAEHIVIRDTACLCKLLATRICSIFVRTDGRCTICHPRAPCDALCRYQRAHCCYRRTDERYVRVPVSSPPSGRGHSDGEQRIRERDPRSNSRYRLTNLLDLPFFSFSRLRNGKWKE